jgi:hypothetical protein
MSPTCPAVLKTTSGDFCVIGTTLDAEKEGLKERTAPHETAVKIPAALLEEAAEAILKHRGVIS